MVNMVTPRKQSDLFCPVQPLYNGLGFSFLSCVCLCFVYQRVLSPTYAASVYVAIQPVLGPHLVETIGALVASASNWRPLKNQDSLLDANFPSQLQHLASLSLSHQVGMLFVSHAPLGINPGLRHRSWVPPLRLRTIATKSITGTDV